MKKELYDIEKKEWLHCIKSNKRREYYSYRLNQLSNVFLKKPYTPIYKKFAGRKVLTFSETNQLISDAISNGTPFWAGRYGMTEMQLMVQTINKKHRLEHNQEQQFSALCNNAGFFPNNIEYSGQFTQKMLDEYKYMDLHAIWPMNMEDFFVRYSSAADMELTRLGCLEPWNMYRYSESNLWTVALKGKKVLVIHPFADSITKQYKENRLHIFDKVTEADKILPEFELQTMRAVQTIADEEDARFTTWFDALDYMVEESAKRIFDVAIIGCGAYGFPLASEIKKMGKVAIHLGGATQLMFGIVGKRWEENENFRKYVLNEKWIRPLESESPKNRERIENGCYW